MNDHISGEDTTAYIDDELSVDKRSAIKSHLDVCAACAREMERFQEIKIRFSRIRSRPAPAQLLAKLNHLRHPRTSWWARFRSTRQPRTLWVPAGVFAAAAVMATVFFATRPSGDDFVDLDSLLVAHSKYQGESLVPDADISQSNYSARLASFVQEED